MQRGRTDLGLLLHDAGSSTCIQAAAVVEAINLLATIYNISAYRPPVFAHEPRKPVAP